MHDLEVEAEKMKNTITIDVLSMVMGSEGHLLS